MKKRYINSYTTVITNKGHKPTTVYSLIDYITKHYGNSSIYDQHSKQYTNEEEHTKIKQKRLKTKSRKQGKKRLA